LESVSASDISVEIADSSSSVVPSVVSPSPASANICSSSSKPHNSHNDVQLVEPVTETPIQHARKRALSGQQIQAGKLMRTTKRKLSELTFAFTTQITLTSSF
jgi:hypothetical protein